MASTLPAAAAIISGVMPVSLAALTSAPEAASISTMAPLPVCAARKIGVMELTRVRAFGFAPSVSSALAIARSSREAAQCSAVIPSPWGALTSAFFASSDRTVATSPACAESATGAGMAALKLSANVSRIAAEERIRVPPLRCCHRSCRYSRQACASWSAVRWPSGFRRAS